MLPCWTGGSCGQVVAPPVLPPVLPPTLVEARHVSVDVDHRPLMQRMPVYPDWTKFWLHRRLAELAGLPATNQLPFAMYGGTGQPRATGGGGGGARKRDGGGGGGGGRLDAGGAGEY